MGINESKASDADNSIRNQNHIIRVFDGSTACRPNSGTEDQRGSGSGVKPNFVELLCELINKNATDLGMESPAQVLTENTNVISVIDDEGNDIFIEIEIP